MEGKSKVANHKISKAVLRRFPFMRKYIISLIRMKNTRRYSLIERSFHSNFKLEGVWSRFPASKDQDAIILIFRNFQEVRNYLEKNSGCNYFLLAPMGIGKQEDLLHLSKVYSPIILGAFFIDGSLEIAMESLSKFSTCRIIELGMTNGQ